MLILRIQFDTSSLLIIRRENDCVTSHCVYYFECVCEHIPKWLRKSIKSNDPITAEDKHPSFSIAKHKIETGHKIDPNWVIVL